MKQCVCNIWAIWSKNTKNVFRAPYLQTWSFTYNRDHDINSFTQSSPNRMRNILGLEWIISLLFFFLGRKFQFLTLQHRWKAARDQHDGENETSCERSCHTSSEQTWRHRPLRLSLNFIPLKSNFQKSIPIYYIYCTTVIMYIWNKYN